MSDTQMDPYNNTDRLISVFSFLESLKGSQNIKGIIISGDLIQHCNQENEWLNYTYAKSFTTIPFYETAGNHDNNEYVPFTWTYYNRYIGSDKQFYSDILKDFVFLGIGWTPVRPTSIIPDLTPFEDEISDNPSKIPLIVTHQYVDLSGEAYSPLAREIQEKLISRYSIVLCGHFDGFLTQSRSYYGVSITESMTSYIPAHIGDLYTITRTDGTVTKISKRPISWSSRSLGSETVIYTSTAPPPTTPVPTVTPTPTPPPVPSVDLIVTSVRTSPASPAAGETVRTFATIQNIGTAIIPQGTYLQVILHIDGKTFNYGDTIPLGRPSLGPGETVEIETYKNAHNNAIQYWVPTAGVHILNPAVNHYFKLTESDYSNNEYFTSISIPAEAPGTIVAQYNFIRIQ